MARPFGLRWRSSTLFIISTITIGMLTDCILYGLLIPVIPFIIKERLNLPQEQLQGITSGLLAAFAAASALASPLAGILTDKMASTRRLPFLIGLAALAASTVLLAVGKTLTILVVARVLQGTSSAVVWTVGLALCFETAGKENFGKTIGTIFSILSVGNIFSPTLGGILYEKVGYIGVFGTGVAIIIVDFIMRLIVIEQRVAARYEDDGITGTTTSNSSIITQGGGMATEQDPLLGSGNLPNEEQEMESAYRLPKDSTGILKKLPILRCLRDPSLLTAFFAGLLSAALIGAIESTAPIVAIEYFHFTSLRVGLLVLPMAMCDLIIGPIAGAAVDKFGTRPVAIIGFLFLVPSLILLRVPHPGGTLQAIMYAAILGLCGVGISITNAPPLVEAGVIMERYNKANKGLFGENGPYAQLYGFNSLIWSIGLTLGPIIAGGLKGVIGYGNMNLVLACLCVLGAVTCILFMGKPRKGGNNPQEV